MSGHNKWSTIKHRKGAQDAKRAKIFTRLIKELTVAARLGGGDPDGNPRLRSALQAARGANMPKDNIERAVKKGTGELDGVSYDELTYEGYGPAGVALLVDVMTDNTNRSVAEVRTVFNKRGGKLGEQGSVAWMFEQRGEVRLDKSLGDYDAMFELALESGAEDVIDGGDTWNIVTARGDLYAVLSEIEAQGHAAKESLLVQVPSTVVDLPNANTARKVLTLIELLEDCDDVQNVWANFDISDEVAAALEAE